MKRMISVGLFMFSSALSADPQWFLSADTWERPRDGRAVTQMPPLAEVVASWSADTSQQLLIRYPDGEAGQLWAYELRSWMVSMGVPLENLELIVGSDDAGEIALELSR